MYLLDDSLCLLLCNMRSAIISRCFATAWSRAGASASSGVATKMQKVARNASAPGKNKSEITTTTTQCSKNALGSFTHRHLSRSTFIFLIRISQSVDFPPLSSSAISHLPNTKVNSDRARNFPYQPWNISRWLLLWGFAACVLDWVEGVRAARRARVKVPVRSFVCCLPGN